MKTPGNAALPRCCASFIYPDLSSGKPPRAANQGQLLAWPPGQRVAAASADVGQRDVSWEVMADPEGHEFCVLTSC